MRHAVLLAKIVDIHQWLEQDQTTPVAERIRRDRDIGRGLAAQDDLGRVLAWWEQIKPLDVQASVGNRVVTMRRLLTTVLFGLGVTGGAALCSVALAYDGDYPVNLMALLGVLVGIPALFVLLSVVSSILQASGISPLREFARALNINRWLMGLWDRLGGAHLAGGGGRTNIQGRFAYWQLTQFSQYFSIGFFAGVLCMYGALVAVTDLAFGWSTTLQIQASSVHQWVSNIALPWSAWWPAAAPGLELTEASRFYRLAGAMPQGRAAQLGDWWPFVLMVILTWGLLPRFLMLLVVQWRLRVATRMMLHEHAEVTSLCDRLVAPSLVLGGDNAAIEAESPIAEGGAESIDLHGAAVVIWNAACRSGAVDAQHGIIELASGDSEALRQLAVEKITPGADKLVVFIKGWEPPVLEFNDLLAFIRERLGTQGSIVVAPLGLAGQVVNATDLAIWRSAIASFGDPRVYVTGDAQVLA